MDSIRGVLLVLWLYLWSFSEYIISGFLHSVHPIPGRSYYFSNTWNMKKWVF